MGGWSPVTAVVGQRADTWEIFSSDNPRKWSPKPPHLYTCVATNTWLPVFVEFSRSRSVLRNNLRGILATLSFLLYPVLPPVIRAVVRAAVEVLPGIVTHR